MLGTGRLFFFSAVLLNPRPNTDDWVSIALGRGRLPFFDCLELAKNASSDWLCMTAAKARQQHLQPHALM